MRSWGYRSSCEALDWLVARLPSLEVPCDCGPKFTWGWGAAGQLVVELGVEILGSSFPCQTELLRQLGQSQWSHSQGLLRIGEQDVQYSC